MHEGTHGSIRTDVPDHVKALIRHIRADATVGPLMQILMRTSQLISGCSTDIFLHPELDLSYIAKFKQKWICKIRDTLASTKAQIYLTDHWTPSLKREKDAALMETFSDMGFLARELAILNRCCLYLQVNLFSEICNADGTRVEPACYSCPKQGFRSSKLIWPAQASPGDAQWRLWRKALDFLVRGKDRFLRQPLGKWLCSAHELDQSWDWYWDQAQNALYNGDGKHSILTSARVTRRLKFSCEEEPALPPLKQCIPADVLQSSEFLSLQSTSELASTPWVEPGIWSDGLLTDVHCSIPIYLLRSTLVLGVGIWLVSDASKQHGKGAYAWAIASESEILCSNSGLVFAEVRSMTSYCAEAFGVLSLVVFLRRLFEGQECGFLTSLKIHCDNILVVNAAGQCSEVKADEDVFLQLRHELKCINEFLKLEFVHVKGHQKLTPFSSRETVLNHWCNGQAKEVVAHTAIGRCQQHFHFPAAKIAISHEGTVGRAITPWL